MLRPGFRSRPAEIKGSGVSGSEGDNSPFQGVTLKLGSYSDSPYPKPHSTHFLVPAGILGRICRTEQYFGPGLTSERMTFWFYSETSWMTIWNRIIKYTFLLGDNTMKKCASIKLTFLWLPTKSQPVPAACVMSLFWKGKKRHFHNAKIYFMKSTVSTIRWICINQ